MTHEFTTQPIDAKERLDRYLHQQLPDLSRARLQALIKEAAVTLNGKAVTKPGLELKGSAETLCITIPEPKSTEVIAQDIPLEVLYEDTDIIVINKQSGLVVHPAAGNDDGTLVNALLHHCADLSGIGGETRPGIVHRLDKETSGCMVVAKHDRAHATLTDAFAHRRISKIYFAAVNGMPKQTGGRIENRIGRHPVDRKRMAVLFDGTGKDSVTEWEQTGTAHGCALIRCRLLTGRTHQIRVHMRDVLACPILGDSLYAHPPRQRVQMPRLMLHAWRLGFDHPITQRPMQFEAKLPSVFAPWLVNSASLT
jgi:23S rRNA pseudouridine1911/1915/1917 synthase